MDFEYDSYIMGKLDPNLLLLLVAGAGGLWFYFKGGGREMLSGLGGGAPPAAAVSPEEDVDPAPEAAKEDNQPEPSSPDVEEEWEDSGGTNIYIIKVDGWMWVNNRRMYPPTDPNWERYYRMKKYRWRHRTCLGRYRNSRWCKDKHGWCSGQWRNTPWCRGFKRGYPKPRPKPQPYPRPPRGGPPHSPPPGNDTNNCRPFISKHGRTYRFTRDPMPDVMPAIFPPPYIKEGNCVYKLDNNQGNGQDGRSGWDGDRGGSSGGNNWWDKIGDFLGGNKTSFYTYNRIGNV
jgi:hypothetical protein